LEFFCPKVIEVNWCGNWVDKKASGFGQWGQFLSFDIEK
jgi:hypothetical protein